MKCAGECSGEQRMHKEGELGIAACLRVGKRLICSRFGVTHRRVGSSGIPDGSRVVYIRTKKAKKVKKSKKLRNIECGE